MTTEALHFDFHGIATMRVDSSAPTAALLRDMFFPFLTGTASSQPDIDVVEAMAPMVDPSFGETEYDYTGDTLLLHDTDVQLACIDGRFRVSGSRELLVSALPVIDRVLVTKGAAMVHAAAIEYRGWGINLPAWGGTGKTSTIAKLLRRDGYAF